MTLDELIGRVVLDPAVCGGTPTVRGTRIPIAVILDRLAEGLTVEQIVKEYPTLAPADIRAALAYAEAKLTQSPE